MEMMMTTSRKCATIKHMIPNIVHTKDIIIKFVTIRHTANMTVVTGILIKVMNRKCATIKSMIPKAVHIQGITTKPATIRHTIIMIVIMIRAKVQNRKNVTIQDMIQKFVHTRDTIMTSVNTTHIHPGIVTILTVIMMMMRMAERKSISVMEITVR